MACASRTTLVSGVTSRRVEARARERGSSVTSSLSRWATRPHTAAKSYKSVRTKAAHQRYARARFATEKCSPDGRADGRFGPPCFAQMVVSARRARAYHARRRREGDLLGAARRGRRERKGGPQ